MNGSRQRTAWCAVLALGVLVGLADRLIAAEPERPQLVVPKLPTAPTMDGKLDDPQWQRAAAISGFISPTGTYGGRLTPSRAKIYLAHDGEKYYVAIDCALPPGVKPSMKYRRRDSKVFMDRYQMEVWLTPPDYGRPTTAYQMIGNAYGAIYDTKHVPSLGVVSSTWNGDWNLQSTYQTGERWTAEVSVPFADLTIADDQPAWDPEQTWGGMVAVAWPQRSWPFTSGWYKNIQTHARLTMSRQQNTVRVDDLNRLLQNELAAKLTLVNGEDTDQTFHVRGTVRDQEYIQEVVVAANSEKQITLTGKLPPMPEGRRAKNTLNLHVKGPGGQTLLKGDWPYGLIDQADEKPQETPEPKPWQMTTRADFAPDAKGLEVWTDLLDYPKRARVDHVTFSVSPQGSDEVLASKTDERFEYDGAEARFWLGEDLAEGTYEVVATIRDADGAVLDEQTKTFRNVDLGKQFYWYGNEIAEDIVVTEPFTPIEVSGQTMRVWGRAYTMNGGFPQQITSQGEAMLAAPIELVAIVNGEHNAARVVEPFTLQESDGNQATFTAAYAVAGHRVALDGKFAFDGMLHYDMTVQPGSDAATLDGLYLSMPVTAETAKYYFTTGGGWSGAFGYVPEQAGDEPFWTTEGFADLVPYIGLTDDNRALQWFGDHAHDWILGDKPMVSLHRHDDAAEARIHLVQKPAKLSDPLEASFGFIASPVKPLPEGWRHTSLHFKNVMDADLALFYGSGHGGCYIDPHDTATLAKIHGLELEKDQDPDAVLAEMSPQWKDIDWERAKNIKGVRSAGKAQRSQKAMTDLKAVKSAYFFNAKMYFESNRSRAFRTFFKGDWSVDPPSGWFHLTPTESYRDFFTFHMDLWCKHWVMPGMYFDEAYLAPDYNVMNGNGRPMPDGSIRPSIPLMQQRVFMQRMRRVQEINGLDPFIWVHSSNYMAPHAISPVDVAMFGEDKAPTSVTDYIDEVPSILMRTVGRSQKFGFVPIWMDQAGRSNNYAGSRQVWGWCWQHDVVPEYHTSVHLRGVLGLRVGWGIAEPDVSFTPFWDNPHITTGDEDVIVSHWTRPGGKVLIQVMNLHRTPKDVSLSLDAAALDLSGNHTIYDAESYGPVQQMGELTDELIAAKAAGENTRGTFREVITLAKQQEKLQAYTVDEMKVVGQSGKAKLTLPARDFRTLIVE